MRLIDRGLVMFDYLARLGMKDTYKAKFETLCAAIDNAPAVDAVEVVRCKDCVCAMKNQPMSVGPLDGCTWCEFVNRYVSPNDFCSRGETAEREG